MWEIVRQFIPLAVNNVPELPNFIELLNHYFEGEPVLHYLFYWEDIFFSLLVASVVALTFHLGIRNHKMIPRGLQNFLELVVEKLRKLIHDVLGPKGDEHLPFLGTLFIYILSMNLFGLIPFMKSPSTSLSVTLGMAICVFMRVQYLNIKNMGLGGFFYHMAGEPKDFVGWLLVPLMLPIELITQISRPATLALRLFGNIMGEHILISAIALFSVGLIAFGEIRLGIPLQTPFMLFALLTSTMQALVFTLLSTVYILLSSPAGEKH
ncbi:MAG: F0F1 ATP synthase subunit A [Parachlamydiales bacterium]|jgi:F-type H+-transporting ATPase subunit a